MTLDSTTSKAVFRGNGAVTVFPFSFRVWDAAEVTVQVIDASGRVSDVTAQCTVTLSAKGGTVTYAPGGLPLPEGSTLAILRNMPFLQHVRLVNGTRFDPAVIEDALDQATAERQQLREAVSRAVRMPASSELTPEEYGRELLDAKDDAAASAAAAAKSAAEAKGHAARTAEIKAAALREVREEGDAQIARLDDLANNHILTFEREVERAHAEADRAEDEANRAKAEADRAALTMTLGEGITNLERTYSFPQGVKAGQTITLEGLLYYVGRNALRLNWEGVELFRGVQFEEIGQDGKQSDKVKLLIAIPANNRLNVWSVASNVARGVKEAENAARHEAERAKVEADRSGMEADRAEAEADRAASEADRAEAAANEATRQAGIAGNAAGEATEQADRAEEAATDAENAAQKAQALACLTGRGGIFTLQSAADLPDAPTGFYIINPALAVPALYALPLTSVEALENAPQADCFFILAGELECPPCPPGGGEGPGGSEENPGGDDNTPSYLQPCGKRRKLLALV